MHAKIQNHIPTETSSGLKAVGASLVARAKRATSSAIRTELRTRKTHKNAVERPSAVQAFFADWSLV